MDLLLISDSSDNSIDLAEPHLIAAPLAQAVSSEVRGAEFALRLAKDDIRTSLKASTLDGVFATIFSNITCGVLVTNFLLELHASPTQIGMLAAIPMLANLVQPIGAHFSEKSSSRFGYNFLTNSMARMLWWFLAIAIGYSAWHSVDSGHLIILTLAIALISALLAGLSSASWMSWMVALVPRRLRGRYYSIRNSASHLTSLIAIPLTGWMVSHWVGGSVQGFGIVLMLGIISGIISLVCQRFMADVNPQQPPHLGYFPKPASVDPLPPATSFLQKILDRLQLDSNALLFLLYFSFWMFGISLSAPFYNFYLLDSLKLDLSTVTFYNSLSAAANLLLLVGWGKVADRFGNRIVLLGTGVVVAIIPFLWLMTSAESLSIWLWLPLLHLLIGGTWAGIDLCLNNLQFSIAPLHKQAAYFGTSAAIAGVTSALGTLSGGFLMQFWQGGGLVGLFMMSGMLRFVALLPLLLIREPRG